MHNDYAKAPIKAPQKQSEKNTTKVKSDKISVYGDENLQKERMKYRDMAYKALMNGDEQLYTKASSWHMRHFPEEFVRFSIEMALKYDSKRAYNDIFEYYYLHSRISEKDSAFMNFLLFNLSKSKELGYKINDVTFFDNEITQSNIKKSSYYLDKMKSK